MPKKDTYHNQFRRALEKDGWKVTHDPFYLRIDSKGVYIDLAAEKSEGEVTNTPLKIAAEIKNFISLNDMSELEKALGQYMMYEAALDISTETRELFLAIPDFFYEEITLTKLYSSVINNLKVRIVVFNVEEEIITKWRK
ncbi:element excision factor XisH family protein [Neolewinella agarilytica]|uniref:XisH protein n=1 Tax=Neolewinella agarilytica TaxID=478744 RepID=A0A1H9BAD4_9BACT|nr:element excision factor XisH family protein [Neolewinella agarilytica]SEP85980.1 XisH protein [Neolewinella agarilytica]